MARKIIILNNSLNNDKTINVNYVYWLTPPAGLVRPNLSGTTVVPNPSAAEVSAIQSGSIVEQVLSANVPFNWTSNVIGQYLIERYNIQQNYLDTIGTMKNYATTYWDGSSWFNLPV